MVIFTESNSGGDIKFRVSDSDTIAFGSRRRRMAGTFNNPSVPKQTFTNEIVVLASTDTGSVGRAVVSVLFRPE